jgi:hypothetical protein
MFGLGIPELAVLAIWPFALAAIAWPAARILSRIGFSPWLSLLALIPVGNLVLPWFVAYARWPGEDGLRRT